MSEETGANRDELEDRVGFGKPPKSGRITRGEVRNPNGRRGKAKAGPINVAEVLSEPILVERAGVKRKMDPFEVSVRGLTTCALKGRSIEAALEFIKLCETYKIIKPTPVPQPPGGVLLVPNDWDWDEWIDMLHRHGPPPWPGERDGVAKNSWASLMEKTKRQENSSHTGSPTDTAKARPQPSMSRTRAQQPVELPKSAKGGPLNEPARRRIVEKVATEMHTATIGRKKQRRSMLELILTRIKASAADGSLKGARAFHRLLSLYVPQEPVTAGRFLVVREPPNSEEEWEAEVAKQQAKYRGNSGQTDPTQQ